MALMGHSNVLSMASPKIGTCQKLIGWISCRICPIVERLNVLERIASLLHIWWWCLGAAGFVSCIIHVWIVWAPFWCIQPWIGGPACACGPNLRWCQCTLFRPIQLWLCSFLPIFVGDGVHVLHGHILLRSCPLPMWIGLGAICGSITLESIYSGLWWYPCLLSQCSNNSLAKNPDCGSPYIPWSAWMNTIPLLSAFSLILYLSIISSGMLLMRMRMNSGCFRSVMR